MNIPVRRSNNEIFEKIDKSCGNDKDLANDMKKLVMINNESDYLNELAIVAEKHKYDATVLDESLAEFSWDYNSKEDTEKSCI